MSRGPKAERENGMRKKRLETRTEQRGSVEVSEKGGIEASLPGLVIKYF